MKLIWKLKLFDLIVQSIIIIFCIYKVGSFFYSPSKHEEFIFIKYYLIVGFWQTLSHLFFSKYSYRKSKLFTIYRNLVGFTLLASILLFSSYSAILFLVFLLYITPIYALLYWFVTYFDYRAFKTLS
jgi:hypothetical protein